MTTTWDHLMMVVLVLVVPFYGRDSYRKFAAKVAAGVPGVRVAEYRWTIGLQWAMVLVVLALWWAASRPLAMLGVAFPLGWQSLLGGLLTAVGLGFLAAQWRAVKRLDEKGREALRAQIAGAAALIPATDVEHRTFRALAITAGLCEELVFRGYLIWYFSTWIGVWPSALVAAAVFGFGHFYQGTAGIIKTGVVGLLTGLLYVGTGSLLWPMILHGAVDLQGGAIGRAVTSGLPESPP